MKRTITLCCLLIILVQLPALAQRDDSRGSQRLIHRKGEHKRSKTSCSAVYIGFSTGINNPVGLIGPQVDIALSPVISIGTGVGLSSWGYKTFLEGRYYFRECNRGWAIGGGFTYNTGLDRVTLPVETIYGDRDIIAHLNPQPNFMISGYHFFTLGRSGRNRFHLQAGFSVPLKEPSFTSASYPELTEDGRNSVLTIAPGGLILGVGFSFAVGG